MFFMQVQPGFSGDKRSTDEELKEVAELAQAAPKLLELLNKAHMALQLAYANLSLSTTEDSKWEVYSTMKEVKKMVHTLNRKNDEEGD